MVKEQDIRKSVYDRARDLFRDSGGNAGQRAIGRAQREAERDAEIDENGDKFAFSPTGEKIVFRKRERNGDDDDLPPHREAEWFLDQFVTFGLSMLGDLGIPVLSDFIAACPMMNVHTEESQRLLFEIFRAASSGRNEAIRADRESK